MSNSKPKQPVSPGAAVSIIVIFIIIFLIFKCCCNEAPENEPNKSPIIDKSIDYNNTIDTVTQQTVDGHTLDDLFEVYHYIYSKGNVIKAETNVLFVDGKNDELQITIDMPDGKTYEYNLTNKVSLGIVKGLDSYLYTSDENDKINVFFKNGREMMGMAAGKEDFVFMNTPNYKE
jgi:hypothetical protein